MTPGNRPFDAQAFKEATQDAWQSAADARVRWEPLRRRWLGPVTQAMFDLAHLGSGDRVLDIGSGTGEPALSAVEVVGPTGYVLATDISSNMLDVAERTARERGLDSANFETRAMDGENFTASAMPGRRMPERTSWSPKARASPTSSAPRAAPV